MCFAYFQFEQRDSGIHVVGDGWLDMVVAEVLGCSVAVMVDSAVGVVVGSGLGS